PKKASEPRPECAARRCPFRLVNDESGESAMADQNLSQEAEHLVIRQPGGSGRDDRLCPLKHGFLYDGHESIVRPHPFLRRVPDVALLQFKGRLRPDVVADVLLIDQKLVDGASCPRPVEIGSNTPLIECVRNFRLTPTFLDELTVDVADDLEFLSGTGHKYNAVCGDALLLTVTQLS